VGVDGCAFNTIVNIPQNVGPNENCITYIFIYNSGPLCFEPKWDHLQGYNEDNFLGNLFKVTRTWNIGEGFNIFLHKF
jgi:hypothetical protein